MSILFIGTGKKGNYAYTAARVKAKKSKLLKKDDYSKMLMMSVPEICNYISDTGYAKEMVDFANKYSGIELLEHATYANMAKAFHSILLASSGELYDAVLAYLERWDYNNLRTILRAKSFGDDGDRIREDLAPVGKLDMDDMNRIIAAPDIDEALNVFTSIVHVKIPAELVTKYKETGILGPLEDHLMKMYYRGLLQKVGTSTRPSSIFRDYIRSEIDLTNLSVVLKLKSEGVIGDKVMEFYIPGCKEIDEKMMAQLAAAPDMETLAPMLTQLSVYEDIKEFFEGENKSMIEADCGIRSYKHVRTSKFSHMYPLSILPVVDYMLNKEIEVGNVRKIARGIESNLDMNTINNLLVI